MGFSGHFAWQQPSGSNVRFGSLADTAALLQNVRFTCKSGHHRKPSSCPLSANSGHRAASSIISLAGASSVGGIQGQGLLRSATCTPICSSRLNSSSDMTNCDLSRAGRERSNACTSRLTVSCGGAAAMRGADRIAGVPVNGPRARRARCASYGVAG